MFQEPENKKNIYTPYAQAKAIADNANSDENLKNLYDTDDEFPTTPSDSKGESEALNHTDNPAEVSANGANSSNVDTTSLSNIPATLGGFSPCEDAKTSSGNIHTIAARLNNMGVAPDVIGFTFNGQITEDVCTLFASDLKVEPIGESHDPDSLNHSDI